MLRVAKCECALPFVLANHQGHAAEAGPDGHESDRPIVVLARRDRGLPLSEVELDRLASTPDSDLAE